MKVGVVGVSFPVETVGKIGKTAVNAHGNKHLVDGAADGPGLTALQGSAQGLHGRMDHTPAEEVNTRAFWNDADEYVLEAPYRSTEGTARMTEKLLDLKKPPTCILYPDDFSAFGGSNVIRQRGLVIGKDISIAGYDGIRIGRHIVPMLTTLRQDTASIGEKAGEKLIELIEKPRSAIVERVVIKGEVFKGGSVGKIK